MATISTATTGNDSRSGPVNEVNTFTGFGIGADTLTGGTLADTFIMKVDAHTDSINGGNGRDRIDYNGSDRALTIALGEGGAQGSVTATYLTGFVNGPYGNPMPQYEVRTIARLTSIEDVVGSAYGDSITGNSGVNLLDGLGGNDVINGLGGADTLIGGGGQDHLIGGEGIDTVSYAYSPIGMNIRLDAPLFSSPDSPILQGAAQQITANGLVAEDKIASMENVIGSAHDDIIKSNGALNDIQGGGGNDVLQSWVDGQRDVMNGGPGSDTIDYSAFAQSNGLNIQLDNGTGQGTASYATGEFTPGVPGVAVGLPIFAFEDTLISIENAIGTSHADTLIGDGQANRLEGGGGDDRIVGGGGADTLFGNGGADTFVFSVASHTAPNARDSIMDFERTLDKIDLSAIDANVNLAGDQGFALVNAFTGTAGQLVGTSVGTTQVWSGDINGDAAADFSIQVSTADGSFTFLSAKDFIL